MQGLIQKYKSLFEQRTTDPEILKNFQDYTLAALDTVLASLLTNEEKLCLGNTETMDSAQLMEKYPIIKRKLNTLEAVKMMEGKLSDFFRTTFEG